MPSPRGLTVSKLGMLWTFKLLNRSMLLSLPDVWKKLLVLECTCTRTPLHTDCSNVSSVESIKTQSRTFGFYMCWADHQTRLALQQKAMFLHEPVEERCPKYKKQLQ